MDLSKIIPSYIKDLPAYKAVEAAQPQHIRLSAMESPYGLEDLQQAWLDELKKAEINRYPVSHRPQFLRRLSGSFGIPTGKNLLLGNGSDEIIMLLLLLCGASQARVLSPSPSFVMYEYLTRILGGTYIGVPLESDFSLTTAAFIQAVKQHKPHLIFLALPNNPSGNLFSPDIVQQTLAVSEGLVVVDQAYRFFSSSFVLPDMNQHSNLLLMHTLSKLGMAGLRFGFLAAEPQLIQELHKLRLPYNINALTFASVQWALENMDYFHNKAALVVKERDELYRQLRFLKGLTVYPSNTNFLLFRCLRRSADEVFHQLKENKIVIKNLHGSHPLLHNCLRVSIGLPDENKLFLQVLKNALG